MTVALEEPQDIADAAKTADAKGIVKRNMLWSAGIGAIAIPIVDLVGITATQIKMIKELSKHYDQSFSEDMGKSVVAGLVASLGAPSLAQGTLGSFAKSIPGIGTAFGMVALPVFAAALTYAVGNIFISHYEMGGTLLNFNPEKTKSHFRELFKEGKSLPEAKGNVSGK